MLSLRPALLLFFTSLLLTNVYVRAADETEDEEKPKQDATETEEEGLKIGPSPDAQISTMFVTPTDPNEIYAGKLVSILVGFANRGEKDFIVHFTDASFRYPMDFSYSLLNLTALRYERTVPPKQEATFEYGFIPNEALIGRPVGLVLNLHYTDAAGSYYVNTVYNETVTIQEDSSNFNTETGFLFIMFAGLVVFGLILAQNFLSKFTRKSPAVYNYRHETGTSKDEVDYEWIPRSHLSEKSPKPGSSPRNRRAPKAN